MALPPQVYVMRYDLWVLRLLYQHWRESSPQDALLHEMWREDQGLVADTEIQSGGHHGGRHSFWRYMDEVIDDNTPVQAYRCWHDTGFDEGFDEGYDLGYCDGWDAANAANGVKDEEGE